MTIKIADGRFAGTSLTYPSPGDLVEILEGENVGAKLEVIKIDGYAFGSALKVYVRSACGEEVWYWPWNIKVIRSQ